MKLIPSTREEIRNKEQKTRNKKRETRNNKKTINAIQAWS